MLDIIFLAIALSMDAFAVSVGLGAKHQIKRTSLALKAGIYFGLFQAIMPLIGYLCGKSVLGWMASYAHWVAWLLLVLIGGKMLYESFHNDEDAPTSALTHKLMLVLAIATSIDAMAAGFALNLMPVSPWVACVIIGVFTFGFSFVGVFLGGVSRAQLQNKAELLGGVVLIAIGFKILLT